MSKHTIALVLLAVAAANGALGWFLPHAGMWLNGIVAAIGVGLVLWGFWTGTGASADSSKGFDGLMLLVIGGIILVCGACGFGWAWWAAR